MGHRTLRRRLLDPITGRDTPAVELHQLAYFLAVAEERSFTRGAARVHVVQSAVSASISRLERELGSALFDRSGRQISLTDAGEALLPEARATLAAAQGARDAVDRVRGGLRGTVTVGSMLSTGPIDLSLVLGHFHAEHPAVAVRLRQLPRGSSDHVEALRDGTLDLALVGLSGRPPSGVRLTPLASEKLRLVCSRDHVLAKQRTVMRAQLARETFIDFPAGFGIRAVIDEAFSEAGIERAVPFEVATYEVAAGLVRNGLGVAFLPNSAARVFGDLHPVDVKDAALSWTVSVATALERRLSAAAQALHDILVREYH
jgi:DNA-binding transcriptional LysR family regulator